MNYNTQKRGTSSRNERDRNENNSYRSSDNYYNTGNRRSDDVYGSTSYGQGRGRSSSNDEERDYYNGSNSYRNESSGYDDGYDDNYSSPARNWYYNDGRSDRRTESNGRNIFERAGDRIREGWNNLTNDRDDDRRTSRYEDRYDDDHRDSAYQKRYNATHDDDDD
ncbi:MAG: hypothetical protein V4677_06560, partial [Bacteroidota bacterium]